MESYVLSFPLAPICNRRAFLNTTPIANRREQDQKHKPAILKKRIAGLINITL